MESNYISPTSVYCLMNKFCSINKADGKVSFFSDKEKKVPVFFEAVSSDITDKYDEVKFMYMESYPKGVQHKTLYNIVSLIDRKDLDDLRGHKNFHIRKARNKWIGKITISNNIDLHYNDACDCLKKWRATQGIKYGKFDHSGKDAALLRRIRDNEDNIRSRVMVNIFFYKKECVGYSIIDKTLTEVDGKILFRYMCGKALTEYSQMCEYIDYKTFLSISKKYKLDKFLIDWGASSIGGVLDYKRKTWDEYYCLPIFNYKISKSSSVSR